MKTLEDIKLTEKDFELLVEGLEVLPNKDVAGEMMGELLLSALKPDKKEGEGYSEFMVKREQEKLESKKKKELLIEDVRILQGKLLQLKRFLHANNLLSKVHEILEKN